ncbi:MAG: hypothetical protein OEU26_06945 [Candidatus Tectomicrobia bacterium]|nr:hypothetical protein [Candidatus Tectomicrobia bacterium]
MNRTVAQHDRTFSNCAVRRRACRCSERHAPQVPGGRLPEVALNNTV